MWFDLQNPPWETRCLQLAEIKHTSSVSLSDQITVIKKHSAFHIVNRNSFFQALLNYFFFFPGRAELVTSPGALALKLRYFRARVTQREQALLHAPTWDRLGGFPPKRVMCSRHRNRSAHLEKRCGCLLLFLLLLATQGRRWWFMSLCPVSLVATLIKKSGKALLLGMAASLLRFGVPSLFLSYILIAIIKKKKSLFSLCLSLLYIYLYR